MSITNAATTTATTVLGTVTTAANVTNAALSSINIVALDLQARTKIWADKAHIDREVSSEDYLDQAIENHAQTIVTRAETREAWFQQNPNRKDAYSLAVQSLRERILAKQPK